MTDQRFNMSTTADAEVIKAEPPEAEPAEQADDETKRTEPGTEESP